MGSKSKKKLTAIVLAAGKGTRMKSPLPKVLHPVAGVPMIAKVIQALKKAQASEVRVVVGYGEKLVNQVLGPMGAISFRQLEQSGTADAVRSADVANIEGDVIILNGDHPLITEKDLQKIMGEFQNGSEALSVVTVELKKPGAFGRIIRQNGEIKAIVEARDASAETLKITEVNTGIYILKAEILQHYLPQIKSSNAQSEFYFTDIVSLCIEAGEKVGTIKTTKRAAFGVNSQLELAKATKFLYKKKCKDLLEQGVVILDPTSTYVEDDVEVGQATVIFPGTYLKGRTKIGRYCVIEPNCFIENAFLAEGVVVKAMTHIEECAINDKAVIGPYARLRPGSEVGEECKIGNFVELKKAFMGKGSKAGHLSYLGDAEIGKNVNIGCGTITCNYAVDKKKYKTVIEDNVFVGSDTQFVAPVHIGADSVIGSGSTITKDVPAKALAVARSRQFIKENYTPKLKEKNKKKGC